MTLLRKSVFLFSLLAAFHVVWPIVDTAHAEPVSEHAGKAVYPDHSTPWKDRQRALVIDAYEKNHINWLQMVRNRQIRAFIGKASDGLPSPYSCTGEDHEKTICKKSFQNYFMKQQLYHTRRALAKNLGLKWGAYHLGRPGNPIEQANHFLEFAKPEPDELIALDIEHDDPDKWISFSDAEIFVRHIHARIGRYPVLYTNHHTARKIAERRAEFPVLSRLPLWYARYRDNIKGVFPMGNWQNYAMWQFSSGHNCSKKKCLYPVKGTPTDIDVNVTSLTVAQFDKAWPFDSLVPEKSQRIEEEPLLVASNSSSGSASQHAGDEVQLTASVREAVGDVLSADDLKELGIAAVAIPAPSPRPVQTADSVNLLVKVRHTDTASSSGHEERKMIARVTKDPLLVPFEMAFDEASAISARNY